MNRFLKITLTIIACLGCTFAMSAKSPAGKWLLLTQNGQPYPGITDCVKIIDKKGNYTILWSYNNGKTYTVMQEGQWTEVLPGVVVENNKMNGVGKVAVNYRVEGNKLFLSFSYPSSPQTVVTQEYIRFDKYKPTTKIK